MGPEQHLTAVPPRLTNIRGRQERPCLYLAVFDPIQGFLVSLVFMNFLDSIRNPLCKLILFYGLN